MTAIGVLETSSANPQAKLYTGASREMWSGVILLLEPKGVMVPQKDS
jgi:hypothetical protein